MPDRGLRNIDADACLFQRQSARAPERQSDRWPI